MAAKNQVKFNEKDNTYRITLTGGWVLICDLEVYEIIKDLPLKIMRTKNKKYVYFYRNRKQVMLSRHILSVPGRLTKFKNGNTLDFRRENIVLC